MSAATAEVTPVKRRGLWYALTNGQTNYEFVRRWRRWATISGSVMLLGLVALIGTGLNLGIDFKGGTVWELKRNDLSVAKARDVVAPFIGRNATIQELGTDRLKIRGEKTDDAERTKVVNALAKAANVKPDTVNVTFVGPSWGNDVSRKALRALAVFFIVIATFISLRFQPKMAIAALAAVAHDVFITVGIYALAGWIFNVEVTPATVVAFLTILGFSLYDTIVVFDKVADNEKILKGPGRISYTDVVNLSMNQTLMRSLNTSLVAVLPVLSLLILGAWVLGAAALGEFGLALLIGLLTGAYSSIFVAAPILAFLKEREEVWTQIRKRLSRGTGVIDEAAGAAARMAITTGTLLPLDADPATGPAGRGVLYPGETPRPRKQGKVR